MKVDTPIVTSVKATYNARTVAVVIALFERLNSYDVEKVMRSVAAYFGMLVMKP